MAKALEHVVILDLSQVLAGPFAVTMLADFGADVIQIEPIGGNYNRRLIASRSLETRRLADWCRRRNRRNMTLDMRSRKGKEIFLKLVERADVVVQNFGPGAMERMGLGYETLKAANPGIIYCAMSGYGQTGPYKDRLAYDATIQAGSGIMSMTGFPENPPVRVGPSIADYAGGVYVVIGILLALHYKDKTGKGQMVDAAMLDALCHWTVGEMGWATATGKERLGNRYSMAVPMDIYETKSGQYLLFAVQTDAQWDSFLKLVGKDELIAEKWSFNTRLQRRDEIEPWAREWAKIRSLEEAMKALSEARIVNSGVAKAADLETDPQVLEREMFNVVDDPVCGSLAGVVGVAPKLSETPGSIGTAEGVPELGQHTGEILTKLLGYSKEQVAGLREEGIVK
jgi:crotonobetainyl-CoA:carnitine CoA-transferase CaiB-like acyl-CoA transferase